jgi:hypothetical protein
MKTDPVPGCPKVQSWTSRIEARAELLRRWQRGDMRCNGTHWCKSHKAFHLTSHAKYRGSNYMYRD